MGQACEQSGEAVRIDPSNDALDLFGFRSVKVTEPDRGGTMQSRCGEIWIFGIKRLIPIGLQLAELRTDAANENVLKRPRQQCEQ